MFKWREAYAGYVNLDTRTDRRERMELTLKVAGIQAERVRGIPWQEIVDQYGGPYRNNLPYSRRMKVPSKDSKLWVMYNRTPGAIGCHFSQVYIMRKALELGKSAFVMEDDLVMCQDITKRLDMIEEFCNTHHWDVLWLGSTFHKEHRWHRRNHIPDMARCNCILNRDWEKTDNSRVLRVYGCWSTYAYLVNYESIDRVTKLLDAHLHESMGIDWLFMRLSPQLYTYCFLPGSIKQYDSKSDIGRGVTRFSGFSSLGPHWYQDTMDKFDPTSFK